MDIPTDSPAKHKAIGIVGRQNSGKTTLVEKLIHEFVGQGLVVSSIKHTHHDIAIDLPGKDSHRHRLAGAKEVIIASPHRWALVAELRGAEEPSLEGLLARLAPCDVVLVEGYKGTVYPKIEVARFEHSDGLIADRDPQVFAVATDNPKLAGLHLFLPLNDPAKVSQAVMARLGLEPR